MKASIHSYAKAIFEATQDKPKAEMISLVDGLLAEMSLKNILSQMPGLIAELEKLDDVKKKIIRAEIKTARQLTKKSMDEIVNFICKRTGAEQVIFTEVVDSSIGGGFIVYFKDTIIDASYQGIVNELATVIGR